MKDRIVACFTALKQRKRKALIPFIMAGDPDEVLSLDILRGLPEAGADIIEFGMPFSDPVADGPVIQAAGERALAADMTLVKLLAMVHAFRNSNDYTPLVLMGYYNPVYHYGLERFACDAAAAGVDGMIIVDLPPEEETELLEPLHRAGIHLIRLIAPTTHGERRAALLKNAQGFVYYISVAGITGAQSTDMATLQENVAELKMHTALPVAVGFGIKTPEQAKAIAGIADAVVVGSALVEIIGREKNAAKALAFVRKLAAAMDN